MEGSKVVTNNVGGERENGSSSDGRPPIPSSVTGYQHCLSSGGAATSLRAKSLVRHPSLLLIGFAPQVSGRAQGDEAILDVSGITRVKVRSSDILVEPRLGEDDSDSEYTPLLRSGAWADIGSRSSMEDVYVMADNLMHDYAPNNLSSTPSAFYGVFDGHGGKHAADFACHHLPRFISQNEEFPEEIERVISSAFLQTDAAFAEACSTDADLASGTTALVAIVTGSSLVVANAGDCRAVLCRRGKAVEMSRDHKPICLKEKGRIEASGGSVYDGYLNGQLNVARALGDWHMEGLKGQDGGPLSAEPEVMSTRLTKDDEFLIIGCDGLWDVFMSQNAVDFARRRLQEHNDPIKCSKDLVDEALKRKSGDNLSVVVVCFQAQPPPNLIVPRRKVQRSISAEGLKELQSFLDSLET